MDRWDQALVVGCAWRKSSVNSGDRARRFVTLLAAFAFLSVTLVACQVTGTNSGNNNASGSGGYTFTTPNAASQSPTPKFPTFTIGAWPSNYSPQPLDNITIYVLCRVQPTNMSGPATAPNGPLTITVQVEAPINQVYHGTTDANGLAAIPVSFSDSKPGTPVQVIVSTQWNGQPYSNSTFFTPGATLKPSPTPTGSVTPGASPSATKSH
jgi:hypothetical protein